MKKLIILSFIWMIGFNILGEMRDVDNLVYVAQGQTIDEFKKDFFEKYSQLNSELLSIIEVDRDTVQFMKEIYDSEKHSSAFRKTVQGFIEKFKLDFKQSDFSKINNVIATLILCSLTQIKDNEVDLYLNYLIYSKKINKPQDIPDEYVKMKCCDFSVESTLKKSILFSLIQSQKRRIENFYSKLTSDSVLEKSYIVLRSGAKYCDFDYGMNALIGFFILEFLEVSLPTFINDEILFSEDEEKHTILVTSMIKSSMDIFKDSISVLIRIFGDMRYIFRF